MKILKRNAVKCLVCEKVIESKYRHNFVVCGCSNETFTDGGLAYQRWGGKDLDLIESLAEYEELTEEEIEKRRLKAELDAKLKLQDRIDKGEVVKLGGTWVSKSIIQLLVDKGSLDDGWFK